MKAQRWKQAAKNYWRALKWEYVQTLRERRIRLVEHCAGCRIANYREPSVRERVDGHARCNDCQAVWEGWRPPRGRELEWREWLK